MTKEYKISIPDQHWLIIAFIIFIVISIGSTGYDWSTTKNYVTVGAQALSLIVSVVLAFSPNLAKIQKIGQEIDDLLDLTKETTTKVTNSAQQVSTAVKQGDIASAVNTVNTIVPTVQAEVQQAVQVATQTSNDVKEIINEVKQG